MGKARKAAFFCHRDCEYYPCHELGDGEELNCLFCYCPLYPLGEECGGVFRVLKGGVKDCSGCTFPHRRENYEAMLQRMKVLWQRFPCQETEP